jgi:hypothetical protein
MCLALAWKLLIRKEVWLRGMDLNHRPLGYEPVSGTVQGYSTMSLTRNTNNLQIDQ